MRRPKLSTSRSWGKRDSSVANLLTACAIIDTPFQTREAMPFPALPFRPETVSAREVGFSARSERLSPWGVRHGDYLSKNYIFPGFCQELPAVGLADFVFQKLRCLFGRGTVPIAKISLPLPPPLMLLITAAGMRLFTFPCFTALSFPAPG